MLHLKTHTLGIGYFDLTASQANLLLKLGSPPEIDFFELSDDLEQKKKYIFLLQNSEKLGGFFDTSIPPKSFLVEGTIE